MTMFGRGAKFIVTIDVGHFFPRFGGCRLRFALKIVKVMIRVFMGG